MFSLELEIARWRLSLGAAGLMPDALDELESHLREEIDRHRREGRDEPQALTLALQHLGDVAVLQREFAHGDPGLEGGMRRTLSRIRSGCVRAVEIKVLAVTGALLGLFGIFQLHRFVSGILPLMTDGMGALEVIYICRAMAMGVVCVLVLRSCWRYLRSQEMAAARALVAFHLFIGWLIAELWFRHSLLRRLQVVDDVQLWRLIFNTATVLVVMGIWWLWMRRLARIASCASESEPGPVIR